MYDNSRYGIEADEPDTYDPHGPEVCGDRAECHAEPPTCGHGGDASQVTVTASRKPCQIVGTATATVEAIGATYEQVLDAGLSALRETKASLFGYGIKHYPHRDHAGETFTGTFVVYADRD